MIFEYASGIYTLKTEQVLPITIEEAWRFFSSPKNLQEITPKNLDFKITSDDLEEAYQGQIITYRIGILPLIKSNWVTEITAVDPMKSFIDEQRFGPYKMWHHRHVFVDLDGDVLMHDKIDFKLPFGFLGRIAFPLLVKPKLKKIFEYRYQKLESLFKNRD